ncbi:hypothetical protein E0198_001281 [Clavispora lusitaniae]|nr:hypothetical protein E0198_001281 [Clavispora lusitaniae]
MENTPIARRLYTADESYLAEANSTLEQFSTPLKRLPDTSVNEVRNEIHSAQQQPPAAFGEPNQLSQRYQAIGTEPLKPISNVALGLRAKTDRDTIFSQQKPSPKPDETVYYRPLSSGGPILSDDFLPVPLPQATRNPIISAKPEPAAHTEYEELDDEDVQVSAPTGEWTSPVVREALRRQVNKERQFRNLWSSVLGLLAFHLALHFLAYFYKLYQVMYFDENAMYRKSLWASIQRSSYVQDMYRWAATGFAYAHHLQWICVFRIVVSLVQLLRPQDQCKDLPLTNRQRRLIGLKEVAVSDDNEEAQLVSKQRLFEMSASEPIKVPKYAQTNSLSGIVRRTAKKEDTSKEAELELQNIIPQRRLVRSGPAFSQNKEDMTQRFARNFNLDF